MHSLHLKIIKACLYMAIIQITKTKYITNQKTNISKDNLKPDLNWIMLLSMRTFVRLYFFKSQISNPQTNNLHKLIKKIIIKISDINSRLEKKTEIGRSKEI